VVAAPPMDADRLPDPRYIINVSFVDHPKRYWIVVEMGHRLSHRPSSMWI
jgi:hypothetical protein